MSYCITEGNALADSTLRETGDGTKVANVVVRVDQRTRGGKSHDDGPKTDYEITVWGASAEPFARTAQRGARIVAAGELTVEQYRDSDGNTRIRNRITAEHHGISSRFAPAVNTRRNGGQ